MSGARNDRFRAINVPRKVDVVLDATGSPQLVAGVAVAVVLETWRIDDEWWRSVIARRYYEVMLDGGKHVVLFEDQTSAAWWMQTP